MLCAYKLKLTLFIVYLTSPHKSFCLQFAQWSVTRTDHWVESFWIIRLNTDTVYVVPCSVCVFALKTHKQSSKRSSGASGILCLCVLRATASIMPQHSLQTCVGGFRLPSLLRYLISEQSHTPPATCLHSFSCQLSEQNSVLFSCIWVSALSGLFFFQCTFRLHKYIIPSDSESYLLYGGYDDCLKYSNRAEWFIYWRQTRQNMSAIKRCALGELCQWEVITNSVLIVLTVCTYKGVDKRPTWWDFQRVHLPSSPCLWIFNFDSSLCPNPNPWSL